MRSWRTSALLTGEDDARRNTSRRTCHAHKEGHLHEKNRLVSSPMKQIPSSPFRAREQYRTAGESVCVLQKENNHWGSSQRSSSGCFTQRHALSEGGVGRGTRDRAKKGSVAIDAGPHLFVWDPFEDGSRDGGRDSRHPRAPAGPGGTGGRARAPAPARRCSQELGLGIGWEAVQERSWGDLNCRWIQINVATEPAVTASTGRAQRNTVSW